MPKSEEEIKQELDTARKALLKDANTRKLNYSIVEHDMMMQDKKQESIKVFYAIVQRYNISGDDVVALLDTVPYI